MKLAHGILTVSHFVMQLPEEFSTEQFSQIFGYANNRSAQRRCNV